MFTQYNIKDNLANIQSLLVKDSIKEHANVQLLKSEEAVREVLKSYADKIRNTGSKLTIMKDHFVKSKDMVRKEQFNGLLEDIFIDIQTMYKEVEYVDSILALNLGRNKKFFNIIKKRIRELWNKLYITRLNVNDTSTFDESYFESFSTKATQHEYNNVDVDKKTGHLTLEPVEVIYQNKQYKIKNINTTTYPVHNEKGGVLNTTNKLNTFEESYRRDGNRDMLENGLWKEQLIVNDIPELRVNIGGSTEDNQMWVHTHGVMSIVDIEFVYPLEINNVVIDLFGDYETSILGILYKNEETDDWISVKKLNRVIGVSSYSWIDNYKEESAFDVINLRNLEMTKSRFLRVVFNQKHYDILESGAMETTLLEEKINDDLSERRYDVVKLDGGSEDRPAIPKSYDVESLYEEITGIIESTRSLEETIEEVINIIEPTPKLKSINFKKTLKYEVGAWSIEPAANKYQGTGKFNSAEYQIRDKSLISVSLNTKQEDIKYNTCNWYIKNPGYDKFIPIIENKDTIRTEPVYFVKPQYYIDKGWTEGYFIQLDFPMAPAMLIHTNFYINGELVPITNFNYMLLNSTLLYIEEIADSTKNKYVVQYFPAIFESCDVYILEKIKEYDSTNTLEYQVVAPRASLLRQFIDRITEDDEYRVKKSKSTILEYNSYFPSGQNICLSQSALSLIEFDDIDSVYNTNIVAAFRDDVKDQFVADSITRDITGNTFIVPSIPVRTERNIS